MRGASIAGSSIRSQWVSIRAKTVSLPPVRVMTGTDSAKPYRFSLGNEIIHPHSSLNTFRFEHFAHLPGFSIRFKDSFAAFCDGSGKNLSDGYTPHTWDIDRSSIVILMNAIRHKHSKQTSLSPIPLLQMLARLNDKRTR